jgi:hypothetical protein
LAHAALTVSAKLFITSRRTSMVSILASFP